ncbi:unnamed protein product [Protopolystoma xenopodis]|uniref:Uncharacterized protein n=1 Tax=Protopolystoma xenopodis TaxID=117903 RepID=A0A3S5A068_9PLAT|nr:unnamed protein product [Protopolystoma xenopodis]
MQYSHLSGYLSAIINLIKAYSRLARVHADCLSQLRDSQLPESPKSSASNDSTNDWAIESAYGPDCKMPFKPYIRLQTGSKTLQEELSLGEEVGNRFDNNGFYVRITCFVVACSLILGSCSAITSLVFKRS